MAKQLENHIFSGMQRDVNVSKHPVQFLFDARNIRLTARQGDTLLAVTNEKGTSDTTVTVSGSYLGHCMLNQYLTVFSAGNSTCYITRIDLSEETPASTVLYSGSLNFSKPIEAIGSYESEKIQKVYWTDGVNQPRMINISPDNDDSIEEYTSTSFDFIPTLQLNETVEVEKMLGASGTFAPGVIQYALTYYNKYGHESNIFYTTPLYYISYKDRGASPEDKVENAFRITVTNVDKTRFDYLRIYSIQRTSINATPICKRIQDIDLSLANETTVSFIDNGTTGNSVDPTELLYKGGEPIIAQTIEQKDNTLFLGNITLKRPNLNSREDTIRTGISITETTRTFAPIPVSSGSYIYYNQLTSFAVENGSKTKKTVPCAGFKYGDYYRLGVQFQHESGRWSDPIWIKGVTGNSYSFPVNGRPIHEQGTGFITIPIFKGTINLNSVGEFLEGYRKVRAVVVYPGMQDRKVICQGVLNPTLYTEQHHTDGDLYAQSSWFFRPRVSSASEDIVKIAPAYEGTIPYAHRGIEAGVPDSHITSAYNPSTLRQVEVQGDFEKENRFKVLNEVRTLHSPDIEFDDALAVMDFTGLEYTKVGDAEFTSCMSDIDIQTESPTISNSGGGFVHKALTDMNGPFGIVSGLFYDDYIVDDSGDDKLAAYPPQMASAKFVVYPWHKTGSLNNDINRPADKGNPTAILKKKVISNLRYAKTNWAALGAIYTCNENPQLFSSNEVSILKIGNKIYQGNIDTSLMPDYSDGVYMSFRGFDGQEEAGFSNIPTPFNSNDHWFKTFSKDPNIQMSEGLRMWEPQNQKWRYCGNDIGNEYVDLVMKKDQVRMKYKSTPHIVMEVNSSVTPATNNELPVIELRKRNFETSILPNCFGGTSEDALRENIWIPCGEPVSLYNSNGVRKTSVDFYYEWGDTYFQRYDCLKTYPFTHEDINQIVEIGSFMLETHTNIDGRYDRNRGQANNLNMSPVNFNMMNPVYSQLNNFFTYRIMDRDYYDNNQFPNQITWTKEKQSGADVDLWTNITLASVYDMDGSKGGVVSINAWKDQLYCFQPKGVSNILFNSRVQIPTSDNNPIEITNSYKVDGYRYISDGIGCNNRLQIKETTSGIYFIDSISGHLHHISENLKDVAASCNMTTWFHQYGKNTKKLLYDDINHDLYVVMQDTALCFSEMLNQFTSFMDYNDISLIESYDHRVFTMKNSRLWTMFEGKYCNFFNVNKPWNLTFISNGNSEGMTDKIFTNLEFRATVEDDGEYNESTDRFTPILPLDYVEVWNEHQHGIANLGNRNGHSAYQHHQEDGTASLKRKFRIWRCDIPRNNAPIASDEGLPNLFRKIRKPLDRMRNPWLYVKLQKNAAVSGYLKGTEIHDLLIIYFA